MSHLLKRDGFVLLLSVAVAWAARSLVLIAGRPEFVGWFNHSPYFWVQSRSVLENGALAYGDMPLLFFLYAGLAKVITLSGMPLDTAVILASRLVMTLAPALIPVAVYCVAKQVCRGVALSWPTRCLVLASGFLPLTFANMPEHLQKNMFGLFLLAMSFLVLYRWLRTSRTGFLMLFVVLLIAICLSHLGSALAAVLLVAALAFDAIEQRGSWKTLVRTGLLFFAVAGVVLGSIAYFDRASLARVQALLSGLLPADAFETLLFVVGVGVWLTILVLLRQWYVRRTTSMDAPTATFGRIVILWLGLLAMPLWPGEIGMRLLFFAPVGAVMLLVLLLYFFPAARIAQYSAITMSVGFLVASAAEATMLFKIYPNKVETARELHELAGKFQLSRNDLVITPYGVTPIANWFLGSKAALLTAVEDDVFEHYDRVFVLNTLERPAQKLAAGECRLAVSDYDRYWTTRHDTPLTENAIPDADFDNFAFYQLDQLPENWVFDSRRRWSGRGECPTE